MNTQHTAPASAVEAHTFHGLGIAPGIFSMLEAHGFRHPTPIQLKAIPSGIEGKDVVGVAQTGTGKTLAFAIPLLQRLANTRERGLVLVPTRELAIQVDEMIAKFSRALHMGTAVLIGGAPMGRQIGALRRDPRVIIATPGRLWDHMTQKTVELWKVSMLVLDEADRMLDMGFWPQIKRILALVPPDRQTMLFSATLSGEIMQLASQHMKLPVRIEVTPPGTTADRVSQEFFFVRKEDKVRLLEKVLGEYRGSVIVFARTKHGATKIMRAVRHMGHAAAEIHGNRSLSQRRDAIDGFKSGKYRVLVATDIAARGIDVKGVELVINFDLPMQAEDYVHRIGRTARAGAEGHAISFGTPDQKRELRAIERLVRKALKVSPLPELPEARPMAPVVDTDERDRRPAHHRRSSFGGGSRGGMREGGHGGGGRPFRRRSRLGGGRRSGPRRGSSHGSRPSF